jgi:antibiotic biosynthesis monooxygenase (ABM) superfamily enzyme
MQWQRDITAAAEGFAGYRATDLYPPADAQKDPWVVVIHFENPATLQAWLDSPVRAEWIAKLRDKGKDFELETMQAGFGAWFVEHGRKGGGPPAWKIVLTVVLALFPTVMLLAVFPMPYFAPLGFAASMLIGNFFSVSILQWIVSPPLNKILQPWLRANSEKDRATSIGGTVAILVVLVVLVLVLRLLGIGER